MEYARLGAVVLLRGILRSDFASTYKINFDINGVLNPVPRNKSEILRREVRVDYWITGLLDYLIRGGRANDDVIQ